MLNNCYSRDGIYVTLLLNVNVLLPWDFLTSFGTFPDMQKRDFVEFKKLKTDFCAINF